MSLAKFQARKQLSDDAADIADHTHFGSTVVWTVLCHSVLSLVTFSPVSVATCIAPGCRRFRGRCGHARVARQLHNARKEQMTADHLAAGHCGLPAGSRKPMKRLDDDISFVVAPNEDQGLEKLPTDSRRGKRDVEEGSISKRVPRNLLPSVGEVADGEAWSRTADWSRLPRLGTSPSD